MYAVARIGNASGRCGIDRRPRPMTVYCTVVTSCKCPVYHKAHGEAASTKLNTVTHTHILTTRPRRQTPAIGHGQWTRSNSDRGRGGPLCGLVS